jgi:hypothetical protein
MWRSVFVFSSLPIPSKCNVYPFPASMGSSGNPLRQCVRIIPHFAQACKGAATRALAHCESGYRAPPVRGVVFALPVPGVERVDSTDRSTIAYRRRLDAATNMKVVGLPLNSNSPITGGDTDGRSQIELPFDRVVRIDGVQESPIVADIQHAVLVNRRRAAAHIRQHAHPLPCHRQRLESRGLRSASVSGAR